MLILASSKYCRSASNMCNVDRLVPALKTSVRCQRKVVKKPHQHLPRLRKLPNLRQRRLNLLNLPNPRRRLVRLPPNQLNLLDLLNQEGRNES